MGQARKIKVEKYCDCGERQWIVPDDDRIQYNAHDKPWFYLWECSCGSTMALKIQFAGTEVCDCEDCMSEGGENACSRDCGTCKGCVEAAQEQGDVTFDIDCQTGRI